MTIKQAYAIAVLSIPLVRAAVQVYRSCRLYFTDLVITLYASTGKVDARV